MIAQQREYKKKKALKKAQRIKELEQEREDQKNKWQQFNNKAYSKNKKGQVNFMVGLQVRYECKLSILNCRIVSQQHWKAWWQLPWKPGLSRITLAVTQLFQYLIHIILVGTC